MGAGFPRTAGQSRGEARAMAYAGLPGHLADRPNFRAAARHSQHVRWLRRAIPWACMSLVIFLVVRSVFGLFFSADVAVGGKFTIEGRRIMMENPHLSGFKRDGSTYEMTAASAVQDLKTPNMVELNAPRARVQTGSEGWANLSGETGLYDSKAETLFVKGNVRVKTEGGTDALLQDAHIEFKAGTVRTDNPTDVKTSAGHVLSDKLQVLDNGKKLVFEGNVRSSFTNSVPEGAPAQ